jgi:hypothetical protein
LKNYSTRRTFFADLTSGLIVGLVTLPLSIALAIASGLKPEIGLFTAIIGGASFGVWRVACANRRTGGRIRAAACAHRDETRAGSTSRLRTDDAMLPTTAQQSVNHGIAFPSFRMPEEQKVLFPSADAKPCELATSTGQRDAGFV